MIGPLRRWQHLAPATRICRASAYLMRAVLLLRAWGLRRWEIAQTLQAVLDAVEAQRGEETK